MAGGFRSLLGVWIGGVTSFMGVPPPVLCPCPEYGHDPTILDLFDHEPNQYACTISMDSSLSQTFKFAQDPVSGTFENSQTLSNNWKRKRCE